MDRQSSSAHWTRKAAWGMAGVSAILLAVWIAPFVSFFLGSAPRPLAFDSESWKRDRSVAMFSTRKRMADDLVAHHPLVGRPWTEVEVLIGPPDEDPYIAPYLPEDAKIYRLGMTPVDSLWLVLEVAEDGTVSSARVMED